MKFHCGELLARDKIYDLSDLILTQEGAWSNDSDEASQILTQIIGDRVILEIQNHLFALSRDSRRRVLIPGLPVANDDGVETINKLFDGSEHDDVVFEIDEGGRLVNRILNVILWPEFQGPELLGKIEIKGYWIDILSVMNQVRRRAGLRIKTHKTLIADAPNDIQKRYLNFLQKEYLVQFFGDSLEVGTNTNDVESIQRSWDLIERKFSKISGLVYWFYPYYDGTISSFRSFTVEEFLNSEVY